MRSVLLEIDGMMCDGCVRRVEKLLARSAASKVEQVTIGSAVVQLPDDPAALESVMDTLQAAGYRTTARG